MINKKLTDFFTEEELGLENDVYQDEWEIIKKIPKEYSDWENLPDGIDDLISGFLDDLFN